MYSQGQQLTCRVLWLAQVDCTAVAGMKPLFWKRVFTAQATRRGGYSHVWFFDSDLEVWPDFDLGALIAVMRGTGAAIAQPAIASASSSSHSHSHNRSRAGGGRGDPSSGGGGGGGGGTGKSTDIEFLRAQKLPRTASCVANTVPVVEVMTPLFDAAAWIGLHDGLISRWHDTSGAKEQRPAKADFSPAYRSAA